MRHFFLKNPMIFLVYTANQVDNKALLKQANDLTHKKYTALERKIYHKSMFESKRGDIVTSDDKSKSISKLKANETLYVVGHGDRDNPVLSGLSPKELADLLQSHGLNSRIKHLKINLVCCHNGHKSNMMTPSFAQLFYSVLLNGIHELDRHHMEKEGSLFTVKAPKHVIGFKLFDGKTVGLKPKDYPVYQHIKEQSPSQLNEWLNQNTSELSKTDFQLL